MKKAKYILFGVMMLCVSAAAAFAQASNIVKKDLSPAEIDRIVKAFTANEAQFRDALPGYAFNRSATFQTIGLGGQVSGTFRRDSFMALSPQGVRNEKILYAPLSTVTAIEITPADIDNLNGLDPFAINPAIASQYNFTYIGMEKIDDLNLYVFEVAPKVMPNWKKSNQKYFSGRIWIDDKDLTIVKSRGKAVPEGKERFPILETWRENVDGKYWFPSYTAGDDELVFDSGDVVKIRVRVKYTNYAVGKATVTISGEDEEVKDEPTPAPSPTPQKP